MGGSLSLSENEKKYYNELKKKIDASTNYKKLFIPDPNNKSIPLNINQIEVGNLKTKEINSTCQELKQKLVKKDKKPEEK